MGGIQTAQQPEQEFKVLKRYDPTGYNQCPHQFKPVLATHTIDINNSSIVVENAESSL
jgi:hypothetical protein